MDRDVLIYIFIGAAITIIVNWGFDQIGKLIRILRDRENRNNPVNTPSTPRHTNANDHMRRMTPPAPASPVTPGNVQPGRVSPRPLPYVRSSAMGGGPARTVRRIRVEDFPRCPKCRCYNRASEPQKVFWDSERHMWRCIMGHYYNL